MRPEEEDEPPSIPTGQEGETRRIKGKIILIPMGKNQRLHGYGHARIVEVVKLHYDWKCIYAGEGELRGIKMT